MKSGSPTISPLTGRCGSIGHKNCSNGRSAGLGSLRLKAWSSSASRRSRWLSSNRRWPQCAMNSLAPSTSRTMKSVTATSLPKASRRNARYVGWISGIWTAIRAIETEGGRIIGVATDKGRIAASRVVVALGSFTSTILKAVRIDAPIYPVKGVSVTFARAGWSEAPKMPILDDSLLFGLLPLGDRMRVAGSAEITGFDPKPAVARCDAIVANAARTFPSLKTAFRKDQADVFGPACALVTPAGTPLIGRTRSRSVDQLWARSSGVDDGLRFGTRAHRPYRRARPRNSAPRAAGLHRALTMPFSPCVFYFFFTQSAWK